MKSILAFILAVTALFASLATVALSLPYPALPPPTRHLFTPYREMPPAAHCAYSGVGDMDSYYCYTSIADGFVTNAGYSVQRGQVRHVYLTMDNLTTETLLASEGWPARVRQWRRSIVMCWPTDEGALVATIRRDAWGTFYARFGGFYRGIERWFESGLNGVRGEIGWVRLEREGRCL